MATFIETKDEKFGTQLRIFCQKVDTHSATLGLNAAKVISIKKDSTFFDYTLDAANSFKTFAQSMNGYKFLLRKGRGDEVLPAFPAIPTLAVAPTLVAANVQKRFAEIIQDCVRSGNYTIGIGEDLGIEKPETVFDPQLGQPEFEIELNSGGRPNLLWPKGKFQGIEIWKDSDGTGFKFLDKDFNPDYLDKSALPAAGTSAVWKYKMIYLFQDEQVGNWSEEVVITVYGNV